MEIKTVFVTVGTTSFDALIRVINSSEMAAVLRKIGTTRLILQYGRGDAVELDRQLFPGIELEVYGLKSSIGPDIARADLVIGHAGAGTCLEVLKAGKRLLVVINDTLMDNHQTELSRALTSQQIVVSCTVNDLTRILINYNANTVKRVLPGRPELFLKELDYLLGYASV